MSWSADYPQALPPRTETHGSVTTKDRRLCVIIIIVVEVVIMKLWDKVELYHTFHIHLTVLNKT